MSSPADEATLARAAEILRGGGIVAFPTETVYGLGADAENESAVHRVFAAKGRPLTHPVIVHLGEAAEFERWARYVPSTARTLAERFWPGPLTLIVPRSPRASDLVTGGQETVAIRVPAHPVAREILARFRGALIAPSANRFGGPSATTADHVAADLGDRVDLIVDGGPTTIGLESTIVDVTGPIPSVVRPGAVTREALEEALGTEVLGAAPPTVRAAGTMPSHYAPRARVELAHDADDARRRVAALQSGGARVAMIGAEGEPPESFAAALYARLRAADEEENDAIVVVVPGGGGLAVAIRDRLTRAAAPRAN
ncbi:MAG: threonylcarbamoyl-AMP synthase [Candidatus Eremiobacteraeota bacterium]|nr:threonylcarbamoyl-AMP synthase [Candidatus Eremiobacteraeota bacterium]